MSATRIPVYQVDAFASRVFTGNPAAVCPLEQWLPDEQMQAIAAENNLAETAFFVPNGDGYHLRWFTPKVEIDLCGHATLASAFIIMNELTPSAQSVRFSTKSGKLVVTRDGDLFARLSRSPASRLPGVSRVDPGLRRTAREGAGVARLSGGVHG
jgi:PhzF family phenazine biosynthesis protein